MLKPALLALVVALLPGAPDSLTLSADRTVVTYGDPVRLSGVVEPATERVFLVGLPYDGGSYSTQAVPDGSGRWSVDDRPLITTQYRARSGAVDSAEAPVVAVRPRVHLVVISARRGLFYTRAESLRSCRGRSASLQRFTAHGWTSVRDVRLGLRSSVRFHAPVPRGLSRVRVVVQPSPGYARGISRVAAIRR